jgi:hypothetical protein
VKQRCVLSLKQWVLRFPQQWRFILWSSGLGHCVAWRVGISLVAAGSYVTLKCWVFPYRITWYPNPQDQNTVGYAVCKLTLGGTGSFACWLVMHLWKVHFNSWPWT